MINQFLATLDNNETAPDQFIWPDFTARTITGIEASIRGAIIGVGLSREQNFIRCLQLVNLVQESPLVGYVTAADARLTYTKQALRDRFAITGVVVQDTSTTPSSATLTAITSVTTPEIGAWSLLMVDSTHCRVTDDSGHIVTDVVSFSSGVSNVFDAPFGKMSFRFTGAAPASGDSWALSYQVAGASWIPQALSRLDGVNPLPILSTDLATWYDVSVVKLDKLAAVVAALGTAE